MINIQQSIFIQSIKIGSISNSSVFQVGTSGTIVPASYLYNTGGFKSPAPPLVSEAPSTGITGIPSLVPI